MKLDKMPYIIYADIDSLVRKIDGCANSPEKSSTMKIYLVYSLCIPCILLVDIQCQQFGDSII